MIKKVIAYMTLGIDVSRLFTEMVLAIETRDLVRALGQIGTWGAWRTEGSTPVHVHTPNTNTNPLHPTPNPPEQHTHRW